MDKYSISQIYKMINFQVDEIFKRIDSISKSLKFVPCKININKEIPIYNFKGQTVDDGMNIEFLENTNDFQYIHLSDESIISGFEKQIINRITKGYITSSDDKVFLLKIECVYVNPILISKSFGIRAGHYFLTKFIIEISYSLNTNIKETYETVYDLTTLSKDIIKYYSDRNIKFKIMPVFRSFSNNDHILINELKREGILNNKLFFKRNVKLNSKYLIETRKINKKMEYKGYEIVAVKDKKVAIVGIYSGEPIETLIIERILYSIENGEKVYLGETKQIYSNILLNEKKHFNKIIYNIFDTYEGIPSKVEYK